MILCGWLFIEYKISFEICFISCMDKFCRFTSHIFTDFIKATFRSLKNKHKYNKILTYHFVYQII